MPLNIAVPDVTKDLSFIHLIQNASVLVQLVMGLLLLVSLMSWWFIFLKMFAVRQAVQRSEEFEEAFWKDADLNRLHQNISVMRGDSGSMGRIFSAGFTEFLMLKKRHSMDSSAVMDGTRRAMRATYQREMDSLESHLAFLATVGSVSPYVGLFGTVWGIMNAFRGLANVQRASARSWTTSINDTSRLVGTSIT